MFLPWVFTGSGVSTTPQRLWPAAPWTETAQGQKKGQHLATARTTTRRVPWPSPLGLPREARGVYVVNGVLDEVLQEVPRPTASISEEDVPLRSQISWTYVNEQEREEVPDQEIEMDLAIQEHLFPKGGEVSHSQHCTVSGPSAQWYVTSLMSLQWYGSQSHSVPRLTR